jgi:hypothetical protein
MAIKSREEKVKEWLLVVVILLLFRMALLSSGFGILPIPLVDDIAGAGLEFLERIFKIARGGN